MPVKTIVKPVLKIIALTVLVSYKPPSAMCSFNNMKLVINIKDAIPKRIAVHLLTLINP